ncbi:MAG: chemotaxis protein CheA [Rhodocyclales bacterium]|nr:chemotaxis protein CheA [Rhodocyclales bacterium]
MDMNQALGTFVEECRDLLAQMEDILLRADSADPDNAVTQDDLHALFRCAHTIKGSGGLFGLDEVVAFTHVVENALDRLRGGTLVFTPDLVSLLLDCKDHITTLVEATAQGDPPEAGHGEALLARLESALATPGGGVVTTPQGVSALAPAPDAAPEPQPRVHASGGGAFGTEHWHLSLRFGPEVLKNGMDPLAFINYLSTLGQIVHVETVSDALPDLFEADPERCYLGFEVALRSDASKAELEGVFEFVHDDASITILPPHSRVDDFIALIDSLDENERRLGEILVSCGTLTRRELDAVLAAQRAEATAPRLGEMLVHQGIVAPPVVEAALVKQKHNEERRTQEARSLKVPADRLDTLINQVGELVIAGSAVQLHASKARDTELQEAAANLLRLVEDMRDTALRLRMTPIGDVFSRFPRVVRDLSKELGKDIELVINGAEAELDKSMVEKIGDPLMHLVRNSIDHGIESPEARTAADKPARGRVVLNAYHESGSIVIEVADDGRGLDTARILQKAVERGIVAADASLTEAEIHRLILAPGFSTAETVTNLSGRGVGMDVVKSSIEALRGTLDIESHPSAGTTMRLCLPLTLAIIDGFQVGVGGATFILPLDAVVECIELPQGSDACDYLNLRDQVLPFLRLRRLFDLPGEPPPRQNIVVISFAGRKAGIAVDRLYGECQTVIKPLGRLFEQISGIAGSTILGSGEVALILDVAQLVQHAAARPHGRSGSKHQHA